MHDKDIELFYMLLTFNFCSKSDIVKLLKYQYLKTVFKNKEENLFWVSIVHCLHKYQLYT